MADVAAVPSTENLLILVRLLPLYYWPFSFLFSLRFFNPDVVVFAFTVSTISSIKNK